MRTYKNLFHVYTQGPHHVYTKVPHHPRVHRDSIMHLRNSITLYTQGPISMYLGNSITHVFSQGSHHACTLGTPSHTCFHKALYFLIL